MKYNKELLTNVTALRWGHQDYYIESAEYNGKEMTQQELDELEREFPELAYDTYYN